MTNRGKFARLRRIALLGTSLAGLVTAGEAFAQAPSYNAGNATVTSGNVTFSRGTNDVFTVNSATAVLDWTPNDTGASANPINFQNANSSATYIGNANFTVLNRIVPTGAAAGRAVAFSGTVNTQVGNGVGGTVWFYSPGGILLSNTAQFNVGNLLLTASDPINGAATITNVNSFAGGGTGTAAVTVNAGAQINALAQGSYIALVAPQITVGGATRVNGQTALVAAEQAQLTINNGLFDIVVTTGSSANNGLSLFVNGTVSGPASTGAGDPHAIYMVAVPRNVATQALIQGNGTVGFDTAVGAGIVNGRVVLTGGYNIAAGNIGTAVAGATLGDVNIIGSRYTSDVFVAATRNAFAAPTTGTPQFDGNLTMSGDTAAHLGGRQNGVTLGVAGNVSLTSAGSVASQIVAGVPVLTATGGSAFAYTENGGRLSIGGNLVMNATATAPASTGLVAARGGTARIASNGGAISVGGTTSLTANANGNGTPVPNRAGATLTGGFTDIIGNTGDITFGGNVSLFATATGSTSASATGATATGGQALVQTGTAATAGRVSVQGDLIARMDALGDAAQIANGVSGSAVGGNVSVQTRGANLSVTGQLSITGGGTGGGNSSVTGSAAGTGTGGIMQLLVDSGSASLGSLVLGSTAIGGTNRGGGTGVGGAGTGGTAYVRSRGSLSITGAAQIFASASGGAKASGTTGGGGAGTGGTAQIVADNGGTIILGSTVLLTSQGNGGSAAAAAGGNGGAGNGGGSRLGVLPTGGTITVTGNVDVQAGGIGGDAANVAGTVGGAGTGGVGNQAIGFQRGAYVVAEAGTMRLNGGAFLNTNSVGGRGATGGAGTGGVAQYVSTGGLLVVAGNSGAQSSGTGGAAIFINNVVGGGAGGQGNGGEVVFTAEPTQGTSSQVQLGQSGLMAAGFGGAGAQGLAGQNGGAGGAAVAGGIVAYARASTLGISTTFLNGDVRAQGGAGGAAGTGTAVGGAGGAATGGAIGFGTSSDPNLPPNTGQASFGSATISANGTGGAGGSGATGGAGGLGTAGNANLQARGTPVTVAGALNITAVGQGGAGGTGTTQGVGGSAIGGAISVLSSNRFQRTERGRLIAGATTLTTSGIAGTGAAGATTTAGAGLIQVTSGDATFASLSYTAAGTLASALQASPLIIDVADGTFGTNGNLAFSSTGNAVISVRDGGVLSAAQLNVTIRGNVTPRATGVATGVLGTIATGLQGWSATSLALQSNLVSSSAIDFQVRQASLADITAAGLISSNAFDFAANNIASSTSNVVLRPAQQVAGATYRLSTGTIATPTGFIDLGSYGPVTTGSLIAGNAIYVDSGAALTINGTANAGILAAQAQGPLPADAGIYLFSSDGAITTGNLTAQLIEIDQGELNANGTTTGTAAPIRVGDVTAESINIAGIGDVTTGALTVRDVYPRLALPSGESPILFAGALGNLVTGNATGTVFGLLGARGNTTLGDLSFTGSVVVTAGQGATVGQVTTGRGAGDLFFASNTSVLFNDPAVSPYFFDLLDLGPPPATPFNPALFLQVNPVAMGGALTVGAISTGTVRTGSQAATFAAINATQRVQIVTSALAGFNGLVISPLIDVTSGDIAIGATGGLGTAATTALNLTATAGTVTIGGTTGPSGYILGDAEAGRLTAAQITVSAPGTVGIGTLTLGGSTAQRPNIVGASATFRINAAGPIQIGGPVTLSGAAASDLLSLTSGQRIDVATDAGGSFLLSGTQASALSGSLAFTAPVIAVATSDILGPMASNPRYTGRDAALAVPTGARPDGYLQAGRITLTASNVIAIQNSGTAAVAGGFTTGAGGLTIVAGAQPSGQPVDVRIYGRTTLANGGFATNDATLATVTRSANNGTFSATAAVNGCLFTATSCVAVTPPPTPPPVNPGTPTNPGTPGTPSNPGNSPGGGPIQISPAVVALVNEATGGEPVLAASVPAIRIVRMLDETAIVEDAQVTDPVAGSANASVWDAGSDEDAEAEDTATEAPGGGGGR